MKTNRTLRSSRCRAALHIASLIALAGPAAAFAQSIPCPVAGAYTVPADLHDYTLSAGTCLVLSGATLTSNGELWNEAPGNHGGTIVNDGTFINNANVVNGSHSGAGGTITNFGTLSNNGSISGPVGATGTVTNAGILVNVADLSADLNNTGTLTNTGTMDIGQGINTVGASIYTYHDLRISGPLNNQGTIESLGFLGSVTLSGTLTNAGTLTNDTGSAIFVDLGTLLNSAGATFTNRGFLSNYAEIDNGGNLANTGTVRNDSGFFVNLAGGTLTIQFGSDFTNVAGAALDNFSTLNNSGFVENDGTLVNGAGAVINNSNMLTVGDGTLINEGSINNTGLVLIRSGGVLTNLTGSTFVQTGGDTNLEGKDSTLDSVPAVQIEAGLLLGDGTINGNVDNDGGAVGPGAEPLTPGADTLTVNGNYTQGAGGLLRIDLNGDTPGDFGVLDVSGLASLDGTLDFLGLPGFTPQAGDDLTFLLFGELAGDFQNIEFFDWTCPMDDTCSVITGAHSMSLDVTANDGGGGTTSVPEPGALSLLMVGLAGLFGTRVTRRRRARPEPTRHKGR